ncbi:MAG: hypothetical protein AAFR05_22935 [Bacteroidota bacterium]
MEDENRGTRTTLTYTIEGNKIIFLLDETNKDAVMDVHDFDYFNLIVQQEGRDQVSHLKRELE